MNFFNVLRNFYRILLLLAPPVLQTITGNSTVVAAYGSILNYNFVILGNPVDNVILEVLDTASSKWTHVSGSPVGLVPYQVFWLYSLHIPALTCKYTGQYRLTFSGRFSKQIVFPETNVVLGMY